MAASLLVSVLGPGVRMGSSALALPAPGPAGPGKNVGQSPPRRRRRLRPRGFHNPSKAWLRHWTAYASGIAVIAAPVPPGHHAGVVRAPERSLDTQSRSPVSVDRDGPGREGQTRWPRSACPAHHASAIDTSRNPDASSGVSRSTGRTYRSTPRRQLVVSEPPLKSRPAPFTAGFVVRRVSALRVPVR